MVEIRKKKETRGRKKQTHPRAYRAPVRAHLQWCTVQSACECEGISTKSAALKAAEEKGRADREQLEKQLQREQTKRPPIGFEHA